MESLDGGSDVLSRMPLLCLETTFGRCEELPSPLPSWVPECLEISVCEDAADFSEESEGRLLLTGADMFRGILLPS